VCLDTFVACSTNADCLRCTGSPTTACTSNGDCTGNGTCAAAPEQPISCGVYCHCGFCDGDPDAPCAADSDCDTGETCEQGAGATQQLQGNKCSNLICGLGGDEQCCSDDTPNCANPTAKVGECTLANYISCSNNADCSSQSAGTCTQSNRPCFENQISRTGSPSPLGSYCIDDPAVTTCTSNADCAAGNCVADTSEPTTVALFCIPPTASASINAAGGIPGPGAISFKSAILTYRCGNAVLEGVEECDDGNNIDGDGCDEICRTEP
jgi:cysteine-rich repeat protein